MNYSDLVKDAFINPIRSVLIVDDEYPTWETILKPQSESDSKWGKSRGKVLDMVAAFRANSPSLIVDIHDGSLLEDSDTDELAKHLYQSDLLVLDYQLDGSDGGGDKSVGIACKLLENDHFNLIVLHTSLKELWAPFEEMVVGLISKSKSFPQGLVQRGQAAYDALEDEEQEEFDDISKKCITPMQYLYCYQLGNATRHELADLMKGGGPFTEFKVQLEKTEIDSHNLPALGVWAMSKLQTELEKKFSRVDHNALSWSDSRISGSGSNFWIRTNKGFIAFANKNNTSDLILALQNALEAWQPTPTRLLSAKLRSELDRQGVIAEDEVFKDKLVFRKFYSNLTEQTDENSEITQRTALEGQARRHVEHLVDRTIEPVILYGQNIIKADPAANDSGASFLDHYGIFNDQQIVESSKYYNSYISSKSPTGWHISPGQIFCTTRPDSEMQELWVCVSPACDLVPGQRKIGIQTKDGSVKSFIAVRLEEGFTEELSSRQINSNEFVFLHSGDKIDVRSIYPKASADIDDSKIGSKQPHWRMFFAKNEGKFITQTVPNLGKKEVELQWLIAGDDGLKLHDQTVEIKWQLRYEYALNLNQKLGGNLTRIGLDFLAT